MEEKVSVDEPEHFQVAIPKISCLRTCYVYQLTEQELEENVLILNYRRILADSIEEKAMYLVLQME